MKKTQQDKKARSEKAAKILRTVDNKDLAKVQGGFCWTCGLIISHESGTVQ
jgi:hypothetical protein